MSTETSINIKLNGRNISLELRNNTNNNVDGLDCDQYSSSIKYYIQATTKPQSHAVLTKNGY